MAFFTTTLGKAIRKLGFSKSKQHPGTARTKYEKAYAEVVAQAQAEWGRFLIEAKPGADALQPELLNVFWGQLKRKCGAQYPLIHTFSGDLALQTMSQAIIASGSHDRDTVAAAFESRRGRLEDYPSRIVFVIENRDHQGFSTKAHIKLKPSQILGLSQSFDQLCEEKHVQIETPIEDFPDSKKLLAMKMVLGAVVAQNDSDADRILRTALCCLLTQEGNRPFPSTIYTVELLRNGEVTVVCQRDNFPPDRVMLGHIPFTDVLDAL